MVQFNFPAYGTITVSLSTVNDLAAFPSTKIIEGLHAIVAGQSTPTDSLGGIFTWVSDSTEPADNVLVVAAPGLTTGRWHKTVKTNVTGAFGAGVFSGAPNYVGVPSDSFVKGLAGSAQAPDTGQGAVAYFEKWSRSQSFNTTAAVAYKTSTGNNARATAVYGEAVDAVGGDPTNESNFVEGGRFQGTLTAGAYGSAYGAICVAGTNPHGPTNVRYLIGCESEVDDQLGPDAPTFALFNQDRFRASFLATNGVGSGFRYTADAAFAVNPYSIGLFQTGYLITGKVADSGVAATSSASLRTGVDIHLANISYASLWAPTNAPIRFGPSGTNALYLDQANILQVGADASRVVLNGQTQLSKSTFGALPSPSVDNAGIMAFVTDAATPITTWRQQVTAGGGNNKALVVCMSDGWFAVA